MDAYYGYNKIRIHPDDKEKMAFMTNEPSYYYRVIPFGLKNTKATYKRFMDKVFTDQIRRIVEVHVNDMVVKTPRFGDQYKDLEEIFAHIRKRNMHLNRNKCAFGVEARKLLGFMNRRREIEANLDKCWAIMEMRSCSTVKEV